MRLSERDVKTNINSEIHASLRRLEDADYFNSRVQSENTSILISQANEANQNLQSQIDGLSSEVYQLHNYIAPHIYEGDLQYFQTLYVGNLQVDSGGSIGGRVTFTGGPITFKQNVIVDGGLDVYGNAGVFAPVFTVGEENFTPHKLTIEGTDLEGSILSTDDLSFSLTGLASPGWSGTLSSATFAVKTNTNNIVLGSTTLIPAVHAEYDSSQHKYKVWATAVDQNGTKRLESATQYTSDTAYEHGKGDGSPTIVNECPHTHSADITTVSSSSRMYIASKELPSKVYW